MTLHWWTHWFWVTLFHSVVAFPLLLPSTFSIPSHEGHHEIIPPVNLPPTAPGADIPLALGHELSASKPTLAEKVAAEINHDSLPFVASKHEDYEYDGTEGPVITEGHHPLARGQDGHDEDSASEPSKEVPLFLEEEGDRGWGLEDPAPRPPFFLQSPELGELYEAVEENEDLHASDGMPWLSPVLPRAGDDSPSQHPTIPPSTESPSASEESWPTNRNPDDSHVAASHTDVSEGGESGVRGPRGEPQHPVPEPNVNSTPLPEVSSTPEVAASTTSLWNLFSSIPPSYVISSSSPSPFVFDSSSPVPSIPDSSSPSPVNPNNSFSPSPSYVVPSSAVPDDPPTLPSLVAASESPSSLDMARVREGKAIGVSHVDQQPKPEQKHVEAVVGGELTSFTTVMPTKIDDVESSPEKSSSKLNATVRVEKEDGVVKEGASLDPKDPVLADSSADLNVNDKKDDKEHLSDVHSPSVIREEGSKEDEEKVVIGPKVEKETEESKNTDSLGSRKSGSEQGRPTQEEDGTSPVEVPTAVAVREGGASVEKSTPEEKKQSDGEVDTSSDKVGKEPVKTEADVPSSVQQGRMTAPKALDAASIVGISLGSVLLVGAVAGGVGFVLYRRSLYANKPQTLNDKCSNPDSSGYIDDTLRVSSGCPPQRARRPIPRSCTEMPRGCGQGRRGGGRGGKAAGQGGGTQQGPGSTKENSEEMYSLDNDSFLNSLEAMTIQNYWTDSVKHTKL